jgi:hypothetical protein
MSVQDRCIECAKRTIGSEIVLDTNRGYSKVMSLKWKLVSVRLVIVQTLRKIGARFAPNVA